MTCRYLPRALLFLSVWAGQSALFEKDNWSWEVFQWCISTLFFSRGSNLAPVIRIIANRIVPVSLKKPGLDSSVLSNFRRISKLCYLSKCEETIVYCQLKSFLVEHDILEMFQLQVPGFKTHHSAESALLRDFNNVLSATDSGHCVYFDSVGPNRCLRYRDHQILLSCLEKWISICGLGPT